MKRKNVGHVDETAATKEATTVAVHPGLATAKREPCAHLNRTEVSGHADRFRCDDCGALVKPGEEEDKVSSSPTTAIVKVDEEDSLCSSPAVEPDEEDSLPSSPGAAIKRMSAEELHKEIIGTYVSLGENAYMYQALVVDARRRMAKGERVGGYETWTEYADCYLKRHDETLPTCLRRLRRALEGDNPDTKHDGSKKRRNKSKSNRQVAEEGAERQHAVEVQQARDRGFEEGRAAERQAQEILAKKKNKAMKEPEPAGAAAETLTKTYYVVRNTKNGKFKVGKMEFWGDESWGNSIADAIRKAKPFSGSPAADNYEWVKVEATYLLTPVAAPAQPDPEPVADLAGAL